MDRTLELGSDLIPSHFFGFKTRLPAARNQKRLKGPWVKSRFLAVIAIDSFRQNSESMGVFWVGSSSHGD
ncbi:MAG: hypothetical protein CMO61_07765 [Verrucomicrobiales bacterium]|nr:hypothetical protein [Verrucomicrobiales bacterium]